MAAAAVAAPFTPEPLTPAKSVAAPPELYIVTLKLRPPRPVLLGMVVMLGALFVNGIHIWFCCPNAIVAVSRPHKINAAFQGLRAAWNHSRRGNRK